MLVFYFVVVMCPTPLNRAWCVSFPAHLCVVILLSPFAFKPLVLFSSCCLSAFHVVLCLWFYTVFFALCFLLFKTHVVRKVSLFFSTCELSCIWTLKGQQKKRLYISARVRETGAWNTTSIASGSVMC